MIIIIHIIPLVLGLTETYRQCLFVTLNIPMSKPIHSGHLHVIHNHPHIALEYLTLISDLYVW